MTTQNYSVTGMTCGHCQDAVTAELKSLGDVTDVSVDLVAGGISTVTVDSETPLETAQVAAALDEAGEYRLAPCSPRTAPTPGVGNAPQKA